MNLEPLRHPISHFNQTLLRIGGYAEKYNPNQTTAYATILRVAGTSAYVYGIVSGNQGLAIAGIGAFAAGGYGDLLDGDHARMLKKQGRWNTKTGGIFDADMDKLGVYSALGGLAFTHTLPEAYTYALLVEVAIMGALDGVSYGMRSGERDWKKILESLKKGDWDEEATHLSQEKASSKNDANNYGKIKTLLQNIAITSFGVGALLDDELAQMIQKMGHPMLIGAIGFAVASLWSKIRRK